VNTNYRRLLPRINEKPEDALKATPFFMQSEDAKAGGTAI
jgi:hypothetical protein